MVTNVSNREAVLLCLILVVLGACGTPPPDSTAEKAAPAATEPVVDETPAAPADDETPTDDATPADDKTPADDGAPSSTGAGTSEVEAAYVIPFEMLQPTWSSWEESDIAGSMGLSCKKVDDNVVLSVNPSGLKGISFDSRGRPTPPTRDGSTIFFETDDCKLSWVNDIIFETDARLSFKVASGVGLVHSEGKGAVTLASGEKINLQ